MASGLAWPYEWCGDGQPKACGCHCLTARAAGATRTWARCRRAGGLPVSGPPLVPCADLDARWNDGWGMHLSES